MKADLPTPFPLHRRFFRQSRWGWFLLAGYLVSLLVSTHLPPEYVDLTGLLELVGGDKVAHFMAYFGLTAILFLFCPVGKKRHIALALAGGLMILGALDELTQPYFGRSCEFADWLADFGGIAVGVIVTQLDPAPTPIIPVAASSHAPGARPTPSGVRAVQRGKGVLAHEKQ